MNNPLHIYTAEELRRLSPIEEGVAKALEKISNEAYTAAAHGRRLIICIVDKNIAYRVKQKLNALGYEVLVMKEGKPDDECPAGQRTLHWVELRIKWA